MEGCVNAEVGSIQPISSGVMVLEKSTPTMTLGPGVNQALELPEHLELGAAS